MDFPVRREPFKYPVRMLVAVLVLLVAAKWQFLGLPSYWDEAYPYAYAIDFQVKNGISLLPGSMPSDYSTGHPTLYYFLQAGWNRLAGEGIFLQRMFPLLISSLALVVLFVFTRRRFNSRIALFAVVLLASRNAFFVQSSFQLPETLITLLTVLTVFSYLENRIVLYMLSCTLLLWCKEPCYMIPLAIVVYGFIGQMVGREHAVKVVLRTAVLSVPFVFGFLFFLLQKIQLGWFFYPRHFNGASVDAALVVDRMKEYLKFIAYYDMNYVFSLVIGFSLVLGIKRKIRLPDEHLRAFKLFALCGLLFLLLSSANRYTSYRYILCLFPFYFVFAAWLIDAVWSTTGRMIPVLVVGALVLLQSYVTFNRKSFTDVSIGYADRVRVQSSAIDWMKEQGLQHTPVYANFLFSNNLRSAAPGYLGPSEVFTAAGLDTVKAGYFIATDCEPLPVALRAVPMKLVRSFEREGAWVRIFKK